MPRSIYEVICLQCCSELTSLTPTSKQDLDALTKRVEGLETGATFDATQEAVRQVQMEMLEKMRAVRSALVAGSNGGASSKELEELLAENAALKKQNAKQAYRIEHLVRSVEELLEKTKS